MDIWGFFVTMCSWILWGLAVLFVWFLAGCIVAAIFHAAKQWFKRR